MTRPRPGFDWLQDNFSALFDAMAGVLEVLIDVILALLQQPPNTGWFQDLAPIRNHLSLPRGAAFPS